MLHNLSLTVGDRESVCLVGRNGAGKTTTIDSIMGLLPVKSGRIGFEGQDITRLPDPQARPRRDRVCSGGRGDLPGPDGGRELRDQPVAGPERGEGGGPVSADNGIDERVLGLFPEIRTFTARRGLFLSGGQKKMVAIGRAMTLSPTILLLDEPFEGLAPVVVSRFIEAVKQIKGMGISLLIAESNLMTASRVADRLFAIDRGEIIFEGEPGRAFENPDVMKTIRG